MAGIDALVGIEVRLLQITGRVVVLVVFNQLLWIRTVVVAQVRVVVSGKVDGLLGCQCQRSIVG